MDLLYILGSVLIGFVVFMAALITAARNNQKLAEFLTWYLIEYRWVLVIPVVLPLSGLFDLFWFFRYHLVVKSRSAPEKHGERVKDIQRQIADWRKSGSTGLLCTARKNWLTISPRLASYKKNCNQIKIELADILEIDEKRGIVKVEPLVDMGCLSRFLLKYGLTLPIFPEMEDLTVGGLTMGYGVESSAHKYGLFVDTAVSFEVVLGDGKVVRASETENPDLFNCLPWTYGTLGFVTAIELRVIPAKKWAHMHYIPTYSVKEHADKFTQFATAEKPYDFIEGLSFSKDKGILLVGNMTDDVKDPSKINSIGWWFKPWFYKHMESFIEKGESDEYIPLRQYYHRYTRSIFWELELIIPFGNHPVFRWLLGWTLPPKVSFLKLTQFDLVRKYYEEKHVIQDILVPIQYTQATMEYFHEIFECYPLWICPHLVFKQKGNQGLIRAPANGKDREMYVDVGAWQVPHAKDFHGPTSVRKMEKWARDHRGYQCLYADTFMTKPEYEQMFDMTLYNRLRKELNAEGAFPHVYEKVRKQ